LFVHQHTNYYFASPYIMPPFSIAFAEVLYEVFKEEGQMTNPAYIRLEDIHPLVDPKNMMDIAKILKEKNIPYMITVIPVYTNPDTGEQYHFSDSPKLLRVLKYMQRNGGSIVLHGYTHQFRLSETGEGFEFWDVEHNMPIYHNQDDEVVIKTRKDFESEGAYEDHLTQQKAFERNYIETRLTRGIQELANYGLYPLAFEAPHYTMSQHGYQVTSEYFSTYVGQLQLSDESWEIMTTAPYITKPTFLHGMTLLPETMGYVVPDDPHGIDKMINLAQSYQFVRDGVVSGFYHPYLGVELFIELIERMEKIPNISWIDLRQINNRVSAENVEIKTEDGELIVKLNRSGLFLTSMDYLTYHIKVLIKTLIWGIAGIGSLAVLIFLFNILISSTRNK
ncbi:MAG: polysaccharide deacetylase family protein, partial [Clostridiaceae bacterium]|nr:polysaccharide deacetylase family protein [Clostridiaceae bacterium]